ncbi:MAG: TetR/AcrR family transcriptional regulator [Deltaproteobacteria bacterium]|nr:TetR/AcrR family transcriptional regulator [Deltaproteobacteria bacterium]
MARPVNADPARTRTRLLEAASQHFSRSGVHGTSLRAVANSAGLSLATINHHFGNKQDLYGACLDRAFDEVSRELAPLASLLDRFTDEVRDANISTAELRTLIESLVREGVRFGRRRRPLLQLIMRTLVETGELEEPWRERALVPFLETTSALLAAQLGRPVVELRMAIQAVIALGMRYSLSTPRELARLAGLVAPDKNATPQQERAAVTLYEDHLVRVAQNLVLES